MPLDAWIAQYGYVATLAGGLIESETVVLLAGLAAHRGLLDLSAVIAVAAGATCTANEALFHVGRLRGHALVARWSWLKPRVARVLEVAHRHHRTLLLLYHFSIGIRAMTPFVLGMSRVRPLRFALLDTSITVAWTAALATLGFWLGDTLESRLPALQRIEHLVAAALFVAGVLFWLARRLWNRARAKRA
jgi:membrane protein DedA with SNARE-associated domain